jgi:nucleoside-triphosphatase THEP1/energy-coupling factor transporter transmembrane protein EcfT
VKQTAVVLLVASTAVVLFGNPLYAGWGSLVAVAIAWILDPPALRAGLRVGAVLAIAFAASITAAVVAWAEGPQRGIELGAMVLLRLLVLTVATAVLVRSVNAEKLLRATRKLGMERLGLVLGLALNSLPRMVESAAQVWIASRVRDGGAMARIERLPVLGEVLLAHAARIAEEAAAAASLRGHSALTRSGRVLRSTVRVVVVTGPRDGGKTATASAAIDRLRGAGVPVAGFLQLGDFIEGQKVGFRLRDVTTGDEAALAVRGEGQIGDFGTPFQFNEEGFQLGRAALSRASAGAVVVIDELGPVELRGQGHMKAVRKALLLPEIRAAIIVVRRTLVPAFLAELEASDAIVVDLETEGENAVQTVLDALAIDG